MKIRFHRMQDCSKNGRMSFSIISKTAWWFHGSVVFSWNISFDDPQRWKYRKYGCNKSWKPVVGFRDPKVEIFLNGTDSPVGEPDNHTCHVMMSTWCRPLWFSIVFLVFLGVSEASRHVRMSGLCGSMHVAAKFSAASARLMHCLDVATKVNPSCVDRKPIQL